MEENFKEL